MNFGLSPETNLDYCINYEYFNNSINCFNSRYNILDSDIYYNRDNHLYCYNSVYCDNDVHSENFNIYLNIGYLIINSIVILSVSLCISVFWGGLILNHIRNEFNTLLDNDSYSFSFIDYNYKGVDFFVDYRNVNAVQDISSNYNLEELSSCIAVDLTPGGYVILYYKDNLFYYWAENSNQIKYNYLETVARLYVNFYKCTNLFYDNCDDVYNCVTNNNVNKNNILNRVDKNSNKKNNKKNEELNACFYSKSKAISRDVSKNEYVDIKTNVYKYRGNISSFFNINSLDKLVLKYIGDYNPGDNSFNHNIQPIYCEFDKDDNRLYIDNSLIDISNNITSDIYFVNDVSSIYNSNDRFIRDCYYFNTRFYKLVNLSKEFVEIEKKLEENTDSKISWKDYKNNMDK